MTNTRYPRNTGDGDNGSSADARKIHGLNIIRRYCTIYGDHETAEYLELDGRLIVQVFPNDVELTNSSVNNSNNNKKYSLSGARHCNTGNWALLQWAVLSSPCR